MKLNHLSELDLIRRTKEVAIEEKRKSRELLLYLAEMDRRGVWGKMGFSSVFNYLVKGLRYSEGEASYRARAMRLLANSAVAAEKMQNGELGLSQSAKLQSFFTQDANGKQMNCEQKNQLINEVSGQPASIVDKILEQKSGGRENKKIKLTFNQDVAEKLEKVKKLYPGEDLNNEKLVEILLDEKIRQSKCSRPKRLHQKEFAPTTQRYIPRQIKETIFQRSSGMCEYFSPFTQQRCQERTHLQMDHILPLSLGGKTEINNLRILCSGHNSTESKIQLGGDFIAKMKGQNFSSKKIHQKQP